MISRLDFYRLFTGEGEEGVAGPSSLWVRCGGGRCHHGCGVGVGCVQGCCCCAWKVVVGCCCHSLGILVGCGWDLLVGVFVVGGLW